MLVEDFWALSSSSIKIITIIIIIFIIIFNQNLILSLSLLTAEKRTTLPVAPRGGGGKTYLGNARLKTFIFFGHLPQGAGHFLEAELSQKGSECCLHPKQCPQ